MVLDPSNNMLEILHERIRRVSELKTQRNLAQAGRHVAHLQEQTAAVFAQFAQSERQY